MLHALRRSLALGQRNALQGWSSRPKGVDHPEQESSFSLSASLQAANDAALVQVHPLIVKPKHDLTAMYIAIDCDVCGQARQFLARVVRLHDVKHAKQVACESATSCVEVFIFPVSS